MADRDDNQQSDNFWRVQQSHQHQHQQVGELIGRFPAHEAMNTSPKTSYDSPTSYMGQLRIQEDDLFYSTFPQARHAPTYGSTASYDSARWEQASHSSGASEFRASSWTAFPFPFPDYRISANAASMSSAKPVALYYDRRQEDEPQSPSTPQQVQRSAYDVGKGKNPVRTVPPVEISNAQKSTDSRVACLRSPETSSPGVSHKASGRHPGRKDTELPAIRLSFEEADLGTSTDQLPSPRSPDSDTSSTISATPPDTTDCPSPTRKHIHKKAKVEPSAYEGVQPHQSQDSNACSPTTSQSTTNAYPQPVGFSLPRGIPLVPLASKKAMTKKPPLACHFCRKRKIACGAPDPTNPDKTCNQCQRRGLDCEYPKESRRGLRKKKPIGGSKDSNSGGNKEKVGKKAKSH